jgi:acetyl-CoA synthetase
MTVSDRSYFSPKKGDYKQTFSHLDSSEDDIIYSSGERIEPFEVERKLIEHPAIAEAGVIGKPDPVRGEIVKAFIVLRKGYEAENQLLEDIIRFVKQKLAAHAAPREIEIIKELPKAKANGNILRRELKARELQKMSRG